MMRGAMLRDIKHYEDMATQAMYIASASNGKNVTAKKLFDGEKARNKLLKKEQPKKDFTLHKKAQEAMKGFAMSTLK